MNGGCLRVTLRFECTFFCVLNLGGKTRPVSHVMAKELSKTLRQWVLHRFKSNVARRLVEGTCLMRDVILRLPRGCLSSFWNPLWKNDGRARRMTGQVKLRTWENMCFWNRQLSEFTVYLKAFPLNNKISKATIGPGEPGTALMAFLGADVEVNNALAWDHLRPIKFRE